VSAAPRSPRPAKSEPKPLRGRREQGRKAPADDVGRKGPTGSAPRKATPTGAPRNEPPAGGSRKPSRPESKSRPTATKPVEAPFVEAPVEVPAQLTGYLAPPGLEAEVLREVGPAWHQHGRLVLCAGAPRRSVWAQDVWLAPQHLVVASINEAANALRAVQRNWVPYGDVQHRRLALIGEALPPIKTRAWTFPSPLPSAPMGAYTLLSRDRLLFSATRQSPFPHGEIEFAEDREGPPSRAYRKLWEVFTLLQQQPQPGERCLDMGASPGGWTWVLAKLGAQVTSVDKAPLAPEIAALPNVQSLVGSAFALRPEDYVRTPFDWFFSDVICYPARLLTMVQAWLAAGAAKRFVCTLKFQGETDHATVAAFAGIPGSRLMHLAHNRHELTWVKL
jgi:23S rRNA (cytidine2498-2'-O)-methyltransferase